MRGHNTLELNAATMMEAIQEWLDKRWGQSKEDSPVVDSIRLDCSNAPRVSVLLSEREIHD